VISFASPANFALALVIVAMVAAIWQLTAWRRKARRSFAGPQARGWPAAAYWPRLVLLLAAAVLIVLAAGRPRWGSREFFIEERGIDLVIALDVSQSMTAADVAPSRLAVAQQNLAALVEAQRGSRIGLVFFAGTAIIRSPLTTDTQAMIQLINRAEQEAGLTRTGSDLGAALDQAALILAASEDAGRAVLVISDGEDHAGTFAARAATLREQGIVIFTAGVGTSAGSELFDVHPLTGNRTRKVDASGAPIISRLDESKLRSLAEAGGGRYVSVGSGESGLLALRNDLTQLDQTPLGAERQQLPIERFQIFTAAALVLLVLGWFLPGRISVPAFARLRRVRPHPGLALVVLALLAGACGSDSLRERNREANELFNAADFEGALNVYQELLAGRPDIDELSYNAGNTLHRLGNFERAVAETQRALPPNDVRLGAATYYALGNHFLAMERFEDAYRAYRSALLLDPGDQDAKFNLELSLLLLNGNQQPPGGGSGPPQQPQGDGQGEPQPGEGTPGEEGEPGAEPTAAPGPGSPNQPGQQPPNGTPSGAEVQRALEEALRGLSDELSFEDAVRILDLLRQQQQRQLTPEGRSTGPDY
jgi:tetratricopeptide (TPR) repeat protein